MRKIKKLLTAVLSVLILNMVLNITVDAEAERTVIIDAVSANKSGYCEIIGHYTNVPVGTQITLVAGKATLFDGDGIDTDNFNTNNMAYIDQTGTGNNGTFLFQFAVGRQWSEETLTVKGGTSYGDTYSTTVTLPVLPPGIEIVDNNSVIYGRDAFYIPGALYTPDKIADSVSYGGNGIYFKIGEYWYDLMDDAAVDNSFLKKENAVSINVIEKLKPRFYYSMVNQIELKYAE